MHPWTRTVLRKYVDRSPSLKTEIARGVARCRVQLVYSVLRDKKRENKSDRRSIAQEFRCAKDLQRLFAAQKARKGVSAHRDAESCKKHHTSCLGKSYGRDEEKGESRRTRPLGDVKKGRPQWKIKVARLSG